MLALMQPNFEMTRSVSTMWQPKDMLQSRYQLKQMLGNNAGRQTWLAWDRQCQPPEPVVIKLLLFNPQMQWDDFDLFEREGKILATLDHPKIPKYRSYFSIDHLDGLTWFAMVQDYIPGISLQQFLSNGRRLTEAQLRKVTIAVLNILIYLHELNPPQLHRDLKPSNLMLGRDKTIYLLDFGAAQEQATEGVSFTIVGTSGYAPPEQFWGRAVPASDLYGLGATLIHLLTGVAPADLPQKDLKMQFSDLVSIQSNWVRWLETLTQPNLKLRFQTARQALEALETGKIQAVSSALPQPANSRIWLQTSATKLDIQLPGIGLSPVALIAFCLKLVLMVMLIAPLYALIFRIAIAESAVINQDFIFLTLLCTSPIWIPWLLSLYGTVKQLLTAQEPTHLMFDRANFLFKWQFREARGQTSTVQDVFESVQIPEKAILQFTQTKERTIVVIQAEKTRYSFGSRLSDRERSWLIQATKDWLKSK